jgi:hypothetical protein
LIEKQSYSAFLGYPFHALEAKTLTEQSNNYTKVSGTPRTDPPEAALRLKLDLLAL